MLTQFHCPSIRESSAARMAYIFQSPFEANWHDRPTSGTEFKKNCWPYRELYQLIGQGNWDILYLSLGKEQLRSPTAAEERVSLVPLRSSRRRLWPLVLRMARSPASVRLLQFCSSRISSRGNLHGGTPLNKCSDRSMEVQLPALICKIITDRPTNQPTTSENLNHHLKTIQK